MVSASEEGDGQIQAGREGFSGKIYLSIWWGLFLNRGMHHFSSQM